MLIAGKISCHNGKAQLVVAKLSGDLLFTIESAYNRGQEKIK